MLIMFHISSTIHKLNLSITIFVPFCYFSGNIHNSRVKRVKRHRNPANISSLSQKIFVSNDLFLKGILRRPSKKGHFCNMVTIVISPFKRLGRGKLMYICNQVVTITTNGLDKATL